ncbi:class I SAM-dependent methyltransferase [Chromatium okenii]|uniref:class I SAM-dependent methyltransferase n=1 Tax=Chromatium okenii TaxID=61644 RepID=UPI0026F0820D|nr:SAM-dependent methyltransferase [Chromatium okenii]MBV5310139.1 SAM-dependent methyltransferase [Chromatium okenii]
MISPFQTASATDFALQTSAQLQAHICAEIAAAGGYLPFDAFMELALYAPGLGYYVAGAHKFGADGDFVTAPELSPLFGQCVAAQTAEVLAQLGGGAVLEFGAGSGALAVAVLRELAQRDCLPEHYWILELSPELMERQRQRIQAEIPHLAPRCAWLTALPQQFRGVMLANEVLDAMPVSRFRVRDDGGIDEIVVIDQAGALIETTAPPHSSALIEAVAAIQTAGFAQTPGYTSEINLRLTPWLAALGAAMDAGVVLLIDYGYPRSGYYQADRTQGTLLCHQRHQTYDDPYRQPGLQDMTAHVDFTAVAEAGIAAGFELAGFTTQAHFLLGCGIDALLTADTITIEQMQAAKQLLLPTAMGERFKVLGLNKNIKGRWSGFSVRDLCERL